MKNLPGDMAPSWERLWRAGATERVQRAGIAAAACVIAAAGLIAGAVAAQLAAREKALIELCRSPDFSLAKLRTAVSEEPT